MADSVNELTELRRRCAALEKENVGLRARLGPGEGGGVPAAPHLLPKCALKMRSRQQR